MDKIAIFENYEKLVVHGGIFHADDVFTCAYLNKLREKMNLPRLKVIRTFSIPANFTEENGYLVADIGKGRFDHHFPEAQKQKRPNGIPYAAFGLVAREYHFGMTELEYDLFDKKFIEPIDAHDNNGCGNQLSFVISTFNKTWDSTDPNGSVTAFFKAVEFAETVLGTVEKYIKSTAKAKQIALTEATVQRWGDCIFLDDFVPVGEFLIDTPIDFVGNYSNWGGYQVMAIKSRDGHDKQLFDEKYRGLNLTDGTYNEVGMKFCHPSGFLANFKDKTTAMEFMINVRNKR